jgi:hypothetical protein
MTADTQTRRINRGRGHSYLIDGQQVDGVTTLLGDGVPKPALVDWAARTTAEYAVDHWDELAEQTGTARLRKLERARWDTTKAAAARGTDVHDLAMRLANGEEVTVPEPLTGHVDAYLRFVEDWHPQELLVEVPVFHRTLKYAGTLDLIADLKGGARWLLDWKTGGSGIFPESALQLAAYRNAEFYLDHDGAEQPMPEVDFCGCVWLRADGYDLKPVDAGDETFLIFRYIQQVVRRFTREPRDRWIADTLAPPARAAS